MKHPSSSRWLEAGRWARLALVLGPVAVLALALSACGGGGGDDNALPINQAPERLKASQPGELLAQMKKVIADGASKGITGAVALGAPLASPAPTAGGDARSNTTVQEAGVDDEDLIKTDGTHLYTLYPRRALLADAQKASLGVVDVHARQGATGVAKVGSLELPYDGQANASAALHHAAAAQRLAVVGQGWVQDGTSNGGGGDGPSALPAPFWNEPRVELRMVGVAAPAQPTLVQSLSIDGWLISSRRIGNVLYLAMTHAPRLPVELWSADAAVRDAALAQLTLDKVLPRIRIDGGAPQALLAETDCYTQVGNASPMVQVSTITAIDLSTLQRASRCFVGGAEALYMSASNLYLATSRSVWSDSPTLVARPATAKTDIHQFALSGTTVNYRASGSVDGHLGWNSEQRPYRLSEHNGHLRVLSFTGPFGWFTAADATKEPSPATLTVLRESSGSLQTVTTLPNAQRPAAIGKPGEQVFGVRFAGERAYVVTFRQIDPLYVLDLASPTDPKTVGVLEVPGFSDYLYPLRGGLLLGVGKDATAQGLVQGVKVGLFDVSNPAAPRELATKLYGGRGSRSTLDFARQGLNLFERNTSETRAALPMAITNDDGQTWQNGLLRITIDTAAKTWRDAPLLASPSTPDAVWHDVWHDRATQIDDAVFYFSRGQLNGSAW
jgi:hypothetical protein